MKLQDQTFSISGTFNIDRLLSEYTESLLFPDDRVDFFQRIEEYEMHIIGAPTFENDYYEKSEKGYGDEWYFKTNDGKTIAIGFRWETARLRGDHKTTIVDVIEFIDYLRNRLK